MNKFVLTITLLFCFFVSGLAFLNILSVKNEIQSNNEVLQILNERKNADLKKIKIIETKIKRIESDPGYAENILMQKFKLLKKDRFIVND